MLKRVVYFSIPEEAADRFELSTGVIVGSAEASAMCRKDENGTSSFAVEFFDHDAKFNIDWLESTSWMIYKLGETFYDLNPLLTRPSR